ncbi:MAG: Phage integrase, N-terminal SAM-like domain [Actinomycetota bacterium]|nr:Phage integrase, N-terminal SAM-like domain [Actinomycetota bacterium]
MHALMERWLEFKRRDLSPTTFELYRGIVENHIIPGLGRKSVNKLPASRSRTSSSPR